MCLVFSMHEETLHAERAIRAGARGYVAKEEPPAKILLAIRKVLSGEIYWSEKAANWVASQIASRPRPSSNFSVDLLTDRELQVFELMGGGQNTRQIAAMLHIDTSTVETYRARIKEKLNLKSTSELLQYAIRFQMLPKDNNIYRVILRAIPPSQLLAQTNGIVCVVNITTYKYLLSLQDYSVARCG